MPTVRFNIPHPHISWICMSDLTFILFSPCPSHYPFHSPHLTLSLLAALVIMLQITFHGFFITFLQLPCHINITLYSLKGGEYGLHVHFPTDLLYSQTTGPMNLFIFQHHELNMSCYLKPAVLQENVNVENPMVKNQLKCLIF